MQNTLETWGQTATWNGVAADQAALAARLWIIGSAFRCDISLTQPFAGIAS